MKKYLLPLLITLALFQKLEAQCPPNAYAFTSIYPQCPEGCGVLLRDWPEGVLVYIYGGDPLSIIGSVQIPGVLGGPGVGNAFYCVPCNIPLVFASTVPGASSGCVIVYLGVLPVTLTNFTVGGGNGGAPLLRWTAATDTRNVTYTVQRSGETGSFTDITSISGRGGNAQNYQYTDLTAGIGNNRYRIRYQDGSGAVSYSTTLAVKTGRVAPVTALFPNPSNSNFKLQVSPVLLPANAQLLDASGRLLERIIITNTVTEFGNRIGKGVYTLRITDRNLNTHTQVLVKE